MDELARSVVDARRALTKSESGTLSCDVKVDSEITYDFASHFPPSPRVGKWSSRLTRLTLGITLSLRSKAQGSAFLSGSRQGGRDGSAHQYSRCTDRRPYALQFDGDSCPSRRRVDRLDHHQARIGARQR